MRRGSFPNHRIDRTASGLLAPGLRLSPAVGHARRSSPWGTGSPLARCGLAETGESAGNHMISPTPAKYTVEYSVQFRRHAHHSHHYTDDPVAATEFLAELLERGFRIVGIQHEGVGLSQHECDRLLKSAANLLAARYLSHSLGISMEEERYRFGFSG